MNDLSAGPGSINRLYWLTAVIAASCFLAIWPTHGFKTAVAFLLGAAASIGNLFLFGYLSRAISPSPGEARPWQGRAFITRYLLLFAGGYVIVKALGVDPLAVILGLLASTAGVLVSIIFELFQRFFSRSLTR